MRADTNLSESPTTAERKRPSPIVPGSPEAKILYRVMTGESMQVKNGDVADLPALLTCLLGNLCQDPGIRIAVHPGSYGSMQEIQDVLPKSRGVADRYTRRVRPARPGLSMIYNGAGVGRTVVVVEEGRWTVGLTTSYLAVVGEFQVVYLGDHPAPSLLRNVGKPYEDYESPLHITIAGA